jgi:hypothetical protein
MGWRGLEWVYLAQDVKKLRCLVTMAFTECRESVD